MSGRGTASGVNFQAEVGALLGLHLALQLPLARISEDLPGSPQRISFETCDIVDDIVVTTEVGAVFIQAKLSLRLMTKGASSLGEVIEAFVRQYLRWQKDGAFPDAEGNRLVVAVGDRTSSRISRDLREALSRVATGAATALPRAQTEALDKLRTYAKNAWRSKTGSEMGAEHLDRLISLVRVVHVRPGQVQQSAAVLESYLGPMRDCAQVVDCLRLWAAQMAERGAGATRLALLQHLEMRCGLRVLPSRSRPKVLHHEEAASALGILNGDGISTMVENQLFSHAQTVSRAHFNDEVRRFLKASHRVMPVIGNSGVGKTTALTDLSIDLDPGLPPRWLVRGADIHETDDGIRGLLSRMVDRAATRHALAGMDVDAIIGALSTPPLIILDAINEAEVPGPYLRHSWIPNTLAWLARNDGRLLFSCRPDRWALMADAFPRNAIHLSAPRDEAKTEANSDPPEPSDVVRLGDFTRAEAVEAVTRHGFAGRIAPDEVRHPFLLAVAADQRGGAADLNADFGTIIYEFIRRRAARAAERWERPNWTEAVMTHLTSVAGAMLTKRTQTLPLDDVRAAFGTEADAVDALCDENLLAFSLGYVRFQHDQVREYLQSSHLTLAAVSAELDPSPDIERYSATGGAWGAFLRASNSIRDNRIRERANRRRDQRSIDPSIGSFVLLRAMSHPGIADLLETAIGSTRLHRHDHGAEWAWQLSVLTLNRMAPLALRRAPVLIWLRRMLEREDDHFATTWPEQFAAAASAALVRSDLSFTELIDFIPLLARQERGSWPGGSIRSRAHLEIFSEAKEPPWQPYAFVDENPVGRLAKHLFGLDPAATARALGGYLDYTADFERKNVRGHCRPAITGIAAVLLYHFRHLDPGATCDAAVAATKGYSADLTEALAITNPAELAHAALARMKDGEDVARLRRVVWNAAEYCSVWDSLEIYRHTLKALESDEPDERIWGARLFLERHDREQRFIRSVLAEHEASVLIAELAIIRNRAVSLLAQSVGRGDESGELPEDYLYLLDESFDLALRGLEDQLHRIDGPTQAAVKAVIRFVSRLVVDASEERLSRAKRLVLWLDTYADRHGDVALGRIAPFALNSIRGAGRSKYELSEAQLHHLEIPELARKVIRDGPDLVMREIAGLGWPYTKEMEELLFDELARRPPCTKILEDLVHSLFLRKLSPFCTNPIQRIAGLRIAGSEEDWDRGARRYLYGGGKLQDGLISYWQGLPDAALTPISRIIIARVAAGVPPSWAASMRLDAAGLTPP